MKKLALALAAVLTFAPAFPVQAKMFTQPLTENFTPALQQSEDDVLDQKLLSVFKGIAAVYQESLDAALKKDYPSIASLDELPMEDLEDLWELKVMTPAQQKKLNAYWETAEALLMPLISEEITEELTAQAEAEFKASFIEFFKSAGIEVKKEDINKLKLDINLIRHSSFLEVMFNMVMVFTMQEKLTPIQTALVSADIFENMAILWLSAQENGGQNSPLIDPD